MTFLAVGPYAVSTRATYRTVSKALPADAMPC